MVLKRWLAAVCLVALVGCSDSDDSNPPGADAGEDSSTGEGDAAGGDAGVDDVGDDDTSVEPDSGEDVVETDIAEDVLPDSTTDVVEDVTTDIGEDAEEDADSGTDVDASDDVDAEAAVCGDGRVEGDESCDDGNLDNLDRCASDCTEGACPGGVVPEEFYPDADGDRFGDERADGILACSFDEGLARNADDCNDRNELVNPRAPEVCGDGIDNNCNGDIDCDDAACTRTGVCESCVDATIAGLRYRAAFAPPLSDDFSPSCSRDAEADLVFAWTAPATAEYTIRHAGSSAISTMFVITGGCEGREIACDSTRELAPEVTFRATEGTTYLIGLEGDGTLIRRLAIDLVEIAEEEVGPLCGDGYDNDDSGPLDCGDRSCLGAEECSCIDESLGRGPLEFTATVGDGRATDDLSGSCADTSLGAEAVFTWTADETGRFRVSGPAFSLDGIPSDQIYVFEGATCSMGNEIACATQSPFFSSPIVEFDAVAGEDYTIVIDSEDRESETETYVIRHTEAGRCGDGVDNDGDGDTDCEDSECEATAACSCFTSDLGTGNVTINVDTRDVDASSYEPSCVREEGAPEQLFTWTADATSGYRISDGILPLVTFDVAISVLDGWSCGTTDELVCTLSEDSGGLGSAATTLFTAEAGEQFTFVIDGADPSESGTATLYVRRSEWGYCDDTIDNEGNGRIDCNDSDCSFDPYCRGCIAGNLGSQVDGFDGERIPVLNNYGFGDVTDQFTPTCGPNGLDLAFRWTEPYEAAVWDIQVFTEDFEPTLTVLNGTQCTSPEYTCDVGEEGSARIGLTAAEFGSADDIVIIVGGGTDPSQTFDLSIQPIFF